MGLVAPLFLLGALAVALPVWLHRLQTKSSNRQPFSSAMLLETTEQQIHVRKKLKYLLLLAFRIGVLLLLALAFAKPFLERAPAAIADRAAGTRLIVLDTSVSMGRSGVFEQAREQARRAINEAPSGAVIQVLAADGITRLVRPPSADRSAQLAGIAAIGLSSQRLDFGRLMSEVERIAQTLPAPVTLHLVSDFQASGMPVQFADVVPAGISAMIPHAVGTGEPVNWSIETVRQSAEGVDVVVQNQGLPDRTVDVQLRIDGELTGVQSASGQGRYLLSFGDIAFAEGKHRISVTLVTDDDLEADNHWYGVVIVEPPLTVPILTDNPGGLPVTYLSAALESLGDARFDVQPMVIGDFDARVLSRYRWAIVDDVGAVDPLLAAELEGFVVRGGNLLAFAGDRSLSQDTLPLSEHRLAAANLGTGVDAFTSIGQFDAQHPILSATEGWHRVNVSRTVAIDLDDENEVLMRLDNGDPFLLEQSRGEGRLLLLLSAVDNRWNDLPVHPVFVGFIVEAANYLSGRVAGNDHYTTGDTLPLSLIGSAAGQVVDPDGESVLSLADTAQAQIIRLNKPGIYEVYTSEEETLVAVNIDPLESDLNRIPQAVLERWRDATYSNEEVATSGGGPVSPEPLELWPWLLLLLAVIAIAESALGNVHIAMKMRTMKTSTPS